MKAVFCHRVTWPSIRVLLRSGFAIAQIGFSLLHSSPCRQCETETDQDCRDTADVIPRSGVMRQDQRGDKAKVEPHRSAGGPEDAPTGSAAGGEHSGDGEYRDVLGVIGPPVRLTRQVRSTDLVARLFFLVAVINWLLTTSPSLRR